MSLMIELTPEALSIGGAFVGGLGWIVTHFLAHKERQIAKLERENAAYRLRIDALQDRALDTLQHQVDAERKQAILMEHFARSLENRTEILRLPLEGS